MKTFIKYLFFGFLLTAILLNACSKKEKVYRVGILTFNAGPFVAIGDGFKKRMVELGYVEDSNIEYSFRFLQFNPEVDQQTLGEFIEDEVDLVFAFPTEPAVAAKTALSETGIPVLFAMSGIEGTGLVEDIRQPGNGLTGVRTPAVDTTLKRLEFLQEFTPPIKRVLIIYEPSYPLMPPTLEKLRPHARSLGITLIEETVDSPLAVKTALQKRTALKEIGIDAVLGVPDGVSHAPASIKAIDQFAKRHKIPFAGSLGFLVDHGATFSYGPVPSDSGTLAAALAHKIFQGIPAGTIPVVTPEAHLKINVGALKQIGRSINKGMMARANEIVR